MVIRKAKNTDADDLKVLYFDYLPHKAQKTGGNRMLLFLVCVAVLLSPATTVYADMGPKPSVQITFTGMEGEDYYGTLLSRYDSTGPASVWDGNEKNARYGEGEYEIWKAFVEYEDADGFCFLQEWWHCSENNQLNWLYRPPSTYKILLYFPERNAFYVSPIYEQYAFDSYYTVDLSGLGNNPVLIAVKCYDYTWEMISLMARIFLTILLELAVALLFGYRQKRQLVFLAAVNIVTQVTLNVWLNYVNYTTGSMWFKLAFYVGEILVLLIESIAYCVLLRRFCEKRQPIWKILLYALTANAVSFLAGFWLAHRIPGIF